MQEQTLGGVNMNSTHRYNYYEMKIKNHYKMVIKKLKEKLTLAKENSFYWFFLQSRIKQCQYFLNYGYWPAERVVRMVPLNSFICCELVEQDYDPKKEDKEDS